MFFGLYIGLATVEKMMTKNSAVAKAEFAYPFSLNGLSRFLNVQGQFEFASIKGKPFSI